MKRLSLVIFSLLTWAAIGIAAQNSPGNPVFHVDQIRLITGDGVTKSKELNLLVEQARGTFNQLYGDYVNWSENSGPTISIKAIDTSSGQVFTVELDDGKNSQSKTVTYSWKTVSPKLLANIVFYLVSPMANLSKATLGHSPDLVDIMDIRDLNPRDVMNFAIPYSVSCKSNGNLVIGQSGIITETDNNGRLIDHYGKALLAQANYSFAYDVKVTPGGTIYSRPASGQEIYIFNNPQDPARKTTHTLEQVGSFAVLNDGSYIVKEAISARTLVYEKGKRTELHLNRSNTDAYFQLAAGPDSTIWVYDLTIGEIRIYAKDGTLLDQLMPLIPANTNSAVKQLLPYPDGSFLLIAYDSIRRFDRHGLLIWSADKSNHPEYADLTMAFSVSFDPLSGSLFYAKPMQKQICRLLDTEWCQQNKIQTKQFNDLIVASRQLVANNQDSAAIKKKAEWYFSRNALDIAGTLYGQVSEIDPDDQESADHVHDIKVIQLLTSAELAKARVLDTIKNIGPETARSGFQLAMQLFEQVLALDSGNAKARNSRNQLSLAMKEAEKGSEAPIQPPIEWSVVRFDPIFPALIASYQNKPLGSIVVKNSLDSPVSNLSIAVQINKFMDFPLEINLPTILKPDDKLEIPLKLPLNQEVLKIEEDLPIQVQLSVNWTANSQTGHSQKSIATTVYRRTALSWDQSGKLASFITPNEETVTSFSMRALDLADTNSELQTTFSRFSEKLQHAITIIDALAAYHIAYLEDPQSPISKVLGKSLAIDTVRFPRTTLYFKNGDCDDSSALLASLLEAAGIKTAILTVPGHVFIAIDTEEPVENAWLFSRTDKVLLKNSTVWIPIETTELLNFSDAWQKAASLVKNSEANNSLEFLPLMEQRAQYPAIPLFYAPYEILLPAKLDLNGRMDGDCDKITEKISSLAIAELSANLPATGRTRITKLNQIGIVYSRFGKHSKAEEIFNQALKESPQNLAAYINLANLYLQNGKNNQSLTVLQKAQAVRPESPMVKLLLAQTWLALGDRGKTKEYFAQVRQVSPDLANRYSHLAAGVDGQNADRAAKAGNEFKASWTIEDK